MACRRRLGPFFVTGIHVAAEQPLVRDGIYRILRHPSETGILAAALGASILLNSWMAAIVWAAVIVPLVIIRVRWEDRVLQQAFGKTYLDYQSRTGGLAAEVVYSSLPSSRKSPSRIVIGCGGQPGMKRSTGTSPAQPLWASGWSM